MKKETFKTARGANITVSVLENTIEVTINGVKHYGILTRHTNKNVLACGHTIIKGIRHPILVEIPNDIYMNLWGKETDEEIKKIKKQIEIEGEAEKKYEENYNKVKKLMEE